MMAQRKGVIVLLLLVAAVLVYFGRARAQEPVDHTVYLPLTVSQSAQGDGPTPEEEALERALNQLESQLTELSSNGRSLDLNAIKSHLENTEGFTQVDVDAEDRTVWAQWSDGSWLVVVDNRAPSQQTARRPASARQSTIPFTVAPAQPPSSATPRSGTASKYYELPASRTAYVFNGLGPAFDSPQAQMAAWLQARGWTVNTNTPTVEELKHVHDAGLFYIDAHGGGRTSFSSPSWHFFTTATPASWSNVRTYLPEILSRQMVMVTALYEEVDGKKIYKTHLAVTPKFVEAYMTFSEESMVFINACSSYHSSFQEAFLSAGAEVYLGWTKPVGDSKANRAAEYLFDRMLGANAYELQSPPNLPASFSKAFAALSRKGYDTDDEAILKKYRRQNDVELLMPRITGLNPRVDTSDINNHVLEISGLFGTVTGTVSMNGLPLPVVSWSSAWIRTELPQSLLDDGGNVIVTAQGRTSNPMTLVTWNGKADYTESLQNFLREPRDEVTGEILVMLSCTLQYYGGRVQYRLEVDGAVEYGPLILNDNPAYRECSYTVSGEMVYDDSTYRRVYRADTAGVNRVGYGAMTASGAPSTDLSGWFTFASLDYSITIETSNDSGRSTETENYTVNRDIFYMAKIDSQWNVSGGRLLADNGHWTFEWTDMSAQPAIQSSLLPASADAP